MEITGRNKLTVHLTDGKQYNINASLSEFGEQLPGSFACISRRCILNVGCIRMINTKTREITVQTERGTLLLLCSQDRLKNLMDKYNA